MSEKKLNLRIAEWTGWAIGRVLDWIYYLDVDLKDANLEDWKDRDIQRHELADEVAELERKLSEYLNVFRASEELHKHQREALDKSEADVNKWKTEANRLYGVGQDIEELRVQLEADKSTLLQLHQAGLAMDRARKELAVIPHEETLKAVMVAIRKYNEIFETLDDNILLEMDKLAGR